MTRDCTYSVTTVQRVPGDYNGDGVVDTADYVVWRKSIGQTGLILNADGDGNQIVDDYDFEVWRVNYGQAVASGTGANGNAAVPEPTTAAMTIAATLFFAPGLSPVTVRQLSD